MHAVRLSEAIEHCLNALALVCGSGNWRKVYRS